MFVGGPFGFNSQIIDHSVLLLLTNSSPPPVSLVLQSLFVPGDKTPDGQLIEAVTLPWYKIIKEIGDDPDLAFRIEPRMWEEIIACAYKEAGWDEVIITPRSGDHGRDVVAVKRGFGTIRVIDQVKAYGPKHLVSADEVRAMLGVVLGDHQSAKGFVTTTSDFAPRILEDPTISYHVPSRLELTNGETLRKRLKGLASS
jgi:restriction system protein